MRIHCFYLLIMFCFVACASYPRRDFSTQLWKVLWAEECFVRLDENNQKVYMCRDDEGFFDVIGISVDHYGLERDYQELLKKSCKRWKK